MILLTALQRDSGMYRCKGRTNDGRRCRRKLSVLDGFCPVHNDRPGVPLEVETLTIDEKSVECFRDDAPTEKTCGHACDLTAEKCCECSDDCPAELIDQRISRYCVECKARLAPPRPQRISAVNRVGAPRNYVRYARRHLAREEEEEEDARVFAFFVAYYAAQARADAQQGGH